MASLIGLGSETNKSCLKGELAPNPKKPLKNGSEARALVVDSKAFKKGKMISLFAIRVFKDPQKCHLSVELRKAARIINYLESANVLSEHLTSPCHLN